MRWQSGSAKQPEWSGKIVNRKEKEVVAERIAKRVKPGDVIGFGSGSTSFLAILAIAKRVSVENLKITAIPTSYEVAQACAALDIPVTSLSNEKPDWSFDGADEVDPNNNLIKGRGGAMFHEKLVMISSPESYILVDKTKLVHFLGEKFPVPIEVFPSAIHIVENELAKLGVSTLNLRQAKSKDGPEFTENGNLLFDVSFHHIDLEMEKKIKAIPGVIESGLFIGYKNSVISF